MPDQLRAAWHIIRRAARVSTRAELDAALARAPSYIVVEGTEALRAYAASLAYRGGQEAASLESAEPTTSGASAYMVVPKVGRIRDGYRQRSRTTERRRSHQGRGARIKLQAGMGTVIAALTGLAAALLIEFLSWPSVDPELIRGPNYITTPPKRGVIVALPTHAPLAPPPTPGQQIAQLLTPILAIVALAAVGFLLWQAIGPGPPAQVSWRVDYRIQGRLIIARVRTRIA